MTGLAMPTFPKRRFQHGAADQSQFAEKFPNRTGGLPQSVCQVIRIQLRGSAPVLSLVDRVV